MDQVPKDILFVILESLDFTSLRNFLSTNKQYYNTHVDNVIKRICQRDSYLYSIIVQYADNWRLLLGMNEKTMLKQANAYLNTWWLQHLSKTLSQHTHRVLSDYYSDCDDKFVIIDGDLVTFLFRWEYAKRGIDWAYPFKNATRCDRWAQHTKDCIKQQFKCDVEPDYDAYHGQQAITFVISLQ